MRILLLIPFVLLMACEQSDEARIERYMKNCSKDYLKFYNEPNTKENITSSAFTCQMEYKINENVFRFYKGKIFTGFKSK